MFFYDRLFFAWFLRPALKPSGQISSPFSAALSIYEYIFSILDEMVMSIAE